MPYRYKNKEIIRSAKGKEYRSNSVYPEISKTEDDIYIISDITDRYDVLANKYYGDASLWWIIASQDIYFNGSLNLKPGEQIRIPANSKEIVELFEKENRKR